jgi:hypothetical protein
MQEGSEGAGFQEIRPAAKEDRHAGVSGTQLRARMRGNAGRGHAHRVAICGILVTAGKKKQKSRHGKQFRCSNMHEAWPHSSGHERTCQNAPHLLCMVLVMYCFSRGLFVF